MTLLILLASIAAFLTFAMFHSRNMMLGFPCGIFWFLAGGQAYDLSTATWDIEYDLFFACFGMGIFSIYAAFAIRRRDLNPKESDWLDGEDFYDEGKKRKLFEDIDDSVDDDFKEWDSYQPKEKIKLANLSSRQQSVRGRAKQRRDR